MRKYISHFSVEDTLSSSVLFLIKNKIKKNSLSTTKHKLPGMEREEVMVWANMPMGFLMACLLHPLSHAQQHKNPTAFNQAAILFK